MVRNFPVYAHPSMKNVACQQRWAGKVREHYHPGSPSAMKMPFFKADIAQIFIIVRMAIGLALRGSQRGK
ncbi:hypothetical protein ALP96_05043 [Pseudomonas savastanoi pv. glycinea]|nr:Uncharacterized protein ALO37_05070 [Pseudomonas savastanoi pv. glycinea]RML42627.1 hypothetical protein ALQ97_05178 [Pseudomonas savastanoi pv. glycinea]RMM74570.1 hypothetical protein ALQ75_05228 [Pseudomonas savastanoi pv. glycinea]RMM95508.1 hypothetical protein ALQ69_04270 [Pseudomonas savastanoi pv. glycinea]RMM99992.1 hypothetical protein ALQ68_05314 [Pseudomonas savastanoi pv. glycinea]